MFRPDLMKGMRILVAGGGTGIGEAMADAYATLGASVYLAGRRAEVVERTAARLEAETGSYARGFACDVRDPDQVRSLVERCWQDGGPIHGLMNSAAGNFISRTEDLSPNAFNAITDIAFRGAFYLTQECGKRWIAEGVRGTVVSVLASWIWNGGPFAVPAAMAKGGIEIMSKSLASEWGKHGIRLHTIAPGIFKTEGSQTRLDPLVKHGWNPCGNPLGRLGELSELANAGVFLMAPGCEFMNGQAIAVDGGAWLANGGNFMALSDVDDEGWKGIKDYARGATDAQKSERSV
ncbi:SDR family oxidoreductase [Novosphingobium pentaromativorans]|nr:SDR family oxidoreductase [Novosphingobium pentaromativorans]